jgi:hypothetical protein
MPDLDQLLENLVSDVTAGTRAPGAPSAITRARRRRTTVAAAAACAVALVVVAGGLAVGSLDGNDHPSPAENPTAPPSPTAQRTAIPVPGTLAAISADLDAIVADAPGWALADGFAANYDYAFTGPCSGGLDDWGRGSISGGDGGVASAGIGGLGFRSAPAAARAVARFVGNLESCTSTAWHTQPIAQTGAVLASSPSGVAWIRQQGADVRVLQFSTTDGPPPLDVQVEVVEWMDAYTAWQDEQND